jgi:hypothetical protein
VRVTHQPDARKSPISAAVMSQRRRPESNARADRPERAGLIRAP